MNYTTGLYSTSTTAAFDRESEKQKRKRVERMQKKKKIN